MIERPPYIRTLPDEEVYNFAAFIMGTPLSVHADCSVAF
jgi:hypothetical protein